jgi:hypothetical protein
VPRVPLSLHFRWIEAMTGWLEDFGTEWTSLIYACIIMMPNSYNVTATVLLRFSSSTWRRALLFMCMILALGDLALDARGVSIDF